MEKTQAPTNKSVELVTSQDILKAYGILSQVVNETPLQRDAYLSERYNCEVYLKREDLQVVRSFKLRGAYYAISQLSADERNRGVVCASAGNHAQGVAFTADLLGVHATIFMPKTTPRQKIDQVKYFGKDSINIQLVGDTYDQASAQAHIFCDEEGAVFVNAFNDLPLIAGQGTVAAEIYQQFKMIHEQPAYIFSAIGGGGLISGVSAFSKAVSPETEIIGVEPAGAASMQAALKNGGPIDLEEIDKFVDGAAVGRVGENSYNHAKNFVDDYVTIEEGAVCTTIMDMYTRSAIVAEPAGALSISALEAYQDKIKGKVVVCIISGGNNDINRMAEIEERSLIYEGYKHFFLLDFPQRAGALKEFVTDIMGPGDDIVRFEYTKKINRGSGPVVVGIDLADRSTLKRLLDRIQAFDPNYVYLNENQMLYSLLV